MDNAQKNTDRFKGFANIYNDARPATPKYVVDILTRYLGFRPKIVSEESNIEKFYFGTLSCGSIQTILKTDPSLVQNELDSFKKAVDKYFGNKKIPVDFCYQMRLGIKK